MRFDESAKILIVGLGLIGGSYAQGLSARGCEVGAIDKKQSSIDFALKHGFIKHGKTEADPEYIKKSYENARFVADRFGFTRIDCTKDGKLKSIDEISDEIMKALM